MRDLHLWQFNFSLYRWRNDSNCQYIYWSSQHKSFTINEGGRFFAFVWNAEIIYLAICYGRDKWFRRYRLLDKKNPEHITVPGG